MIKINGQINLILVLTYFVPEGAMLPTSFNYLFNVTQQSDSEKRRLFLLNNITESITAQLYLTKQKN